MKILIDCETSGEVRRAFRRLGHDAWSCDILPSDDDSPHHIIGDAVEVAYSMPWDLMIAHPPCTYLSVSGMHWTVRGLRDPMLTEEALRFFRRLLNAPIPLKALENPISVASTRIRPADQIIQPWQFGHPESKATALWLVGLPLLKPTNVLPLPESGRWQNQTASGQNKLAPSADRWKIRSATYPGIAQAMAQQWGAVVQDAGRAASHWEPKQQLQLVFA